MEQVIMKWERSKDKSAEEYVQEFGNKSKQRSGDTESHSIMEVE